MDSTREYHTRYLNAMNNPLRRDILRFLKQSSKTIKELHLSTGMAPEVLQWHLSVLEHGSCVKKVCREGEAVYEITQEGKVVDYMDK